MSNFSTVLRHARIERRWTIRKLARESGISHSTLSNYERQVSRPSLAICRAALKAVEL